MKIQYKKLVALSAFLMSIQAFSQSSFIARWGFSVGNNCYNHNTIDIKTDANGNHITAGTLAAFDGNSGISMPDLDPSPGIFWLNPSLSNDFYIAKYDTDGNFISAFVIGGTGVDVCNSIAIDNGNNTIATGVFRGTVDFDPSAATSTLSSNGLDDIFLAKYTNNGALIWVKSIGGATNDKGVKVITDNQNNIFLTGTYSGTLDIDPSATTNTIASNGNTDVFIAKFDSNGNLLNAKSFGDVGTETVVDIVLDADKKLYITGVFTNTVDFDPQPINTYTLSDVGGAGDTYISKFDSLLSFQWAKSLSSNNTNYPKDINIDNTGNILMSGYYALSALDLDPSASTYTVSNPGKDNFGYISKYDNNGNFLWGGVYAGVSSFGGEVLSAISIWSDNSGNVYNVGKYAGSVDFDFSASTYTLNNSTYAPSVYYAKYSSTGSFVEAKSISSAFMYPNTAHVDAQGSLLMVGSINNPVNIDPTGSNPLTLNYYQVCGNITYGFASKHNVCNTPTVSAVSTNSTNICAGSTITLSLTGSLNDATNWLWSQNSCTTNTIGVGSSIVVTPTANTVYNVKGVGACAGKLLACNTISISTIPQPTLAVSASSSTVCPNATFTLNALGANTYTWSNGNTTSSTTTSVTSTSIFSVTGTNTLGCNTTNTIIVNAYSVPPITILAFPNNSVTTYCSDQIIDLRASGSNTYVWLNPNGGSYQPFWNGTSYDSYYYANGLASSTVFTVTGTTINGCSNYGTISITIISCVGIDEYSNQFSSLKIYPNPTNNLINIEVEEKSTLSVSIKNTMGQVVLKKDFKHLNTDFSLDVTNLSSGIYFIEITDEHKSKAIKKIIKD